MIKLDSRSNCSVANFLDKSPEENEDYFIAQSSTKNHISWYSMLDGAGGVGVFNKSWAEFLGSNISCNNIYDNKLNDFINTISERFYSEVISKMNLSDLLLNKKVHREGSFTTLNVCWLDKYNDTIYYSSIGDTCLFIFEKVNNQYNISLSSTLIEQNSFDQFTKLINWNIEVDYPVFINQRILTESFVLVMATDSLAKWILLNIAIIDFNSLVSLGFNERFISTLNSEKLRSRKEAMQVGSAIKSIDELLDYLDRILVSQDAFIQHLKSLYIQNELDIDDFSLAVIKANVS